MKRLESFMNENRPWILIPNPAHDGSDTSTGIKPMLRYCSESGNLYCPLSYAYRRITGRVVDPIRWESLGLALGMDLDEARLVARVGFGYYVPEITESLHRITHAKLVTHEEGEALLAVRQEPYHTVLSS